MSSFLDRWLYRDNSVHNMGMKNSNTGTSYTKTGVMSTGKYNPKYATHMATPQDKTTPNLQNVPWAYYSDVEKTRRSSTTSTSSSTSEQEM